MAVNRTRLTQARHAEKPRPTPGPTPMLLSGSRTALATMVRLKAALLMIALLPTLAGCASTPTADSAIAPTVATATPDAAPGPLDPVSSPQWRTDMDRFAAEDRATPPPAHPVVFTGSSSVRMWATLAQDFPAVPVLNGGFGGSQLRDAVWHADEVAVRYAPRRIVLYAGDNDIDAGRTPQQVLSDFRAFVARVRRDLPDVPIAYLAIKPSLARVSQLPRQREANALIAAEARTLRDVSFVDVATPMLDADGQPRPELFGPDGLHMTPQGYALWRGIVAPYLR